METTIEEKFVKWAAEEISKIFTGEVRKSFLKELSVPIEENFPLEESFINDIKELATTYLFRGKGDVCPPYEEVARKVILYLQESLKKEIIANQQILVG
jgi:hypothetical protein